MYFRPALFMALLGGVLIPGVMGLILLGLPGLFLYDFVISLLGWPSIKDLDQSSSPPGTVYWGVGLVLSFLWPFGIPAGYALATLAPLPRLWMRWGLGMMVFCLWCGLAVIILHQRTLAGK